MCQGLLVIETARSDSVRHTTLGRYPLDESSARLRDFYLTTDNIQKRHTFMPLEGFEPTIPARERPAEGDTMKVNWIHYIMMLI
jgi:hypothetical protein